MKIYDLTEIISVFLAVIGCGAITAAAAMVSAPLGVLAAGTFFVFFGLTGIYVSGKAEQQATQPARQDGTLP